jgi:DNA polymerase-3 subunit gamma/tau
MSNEKALYTKCRPIQISEVVGQKRVVNSIIKQSESDSFSHAYLFCGQYGSGKTTVARIVASLMNCPNKKGSVVCGKCRVCTSIHDGYCVDVYEVDAASNRGIDDARKIKETAYHSPQELKRKIYIIDECHMLTTEAWNSLLKVVEEPPAYVTFIFCTTDHRKVPTTISSRCQRFVFTQISVQETINHIKDVAKKEGISIDDKVVSDIAKLSRGSMRDAISHLDWISVVKDKFVKESDSQEYFGIPDSNISYEIVKLMIEQNPSAVLEKVNVLMQAGVDAKSILSDISNILRNVFVCNVCGESTTLLDVIDSERKIICDLSKKVSKNNLIKVASAMSRIEKEINLNINERWIIEAALINCLIILKNENSTTK